ncbi:MAG: ATP-binding protein [Acidobacteriota bacterium]|jgi:predicted AAA+ superfamily ATPase|nr:ATP-binding protein [Acidobacteriota bacterium]
MEDRIRQAISEKVADAVSGDFPETIRREARLPAIPGKAHAVTGMRRAGKTCFLMQCLADALVDGVERERLVYLNLEDDRLGELSGEELSAAVEAYYGLFPEFRRTREVWFCFDEIQLVPQWERFVRRLLDTEKVRVLLSGSSAKMLSREVATSMRGRALETVMTPYGFREFLSARRVGAGDVAAEAAAPSAKTRSLLQKGLSDYLEVGGFPEVVAASMAGAGAKTRIRLLQSYVDAVVFRDVAERHSVGNLTALRAFVRQLMRMPASALSVNKISNDFRSRGIAASKETLLAFLDYLSDAFLVAAVPLFSSSERRRQVNPRKLYLADHSLAAAFSPADGLNRGRLLENVVAVELFRRMRDIGYYKTSSGLEVDFCVFDFSGSQHLIQVAADVGDPKTWNREVASLVEASGEQPEASLWLLCEDPSALGPVNTPVGVRVLPVWQWLAMRD